MTPRRAWTASAAVAACLLAATAGALPAGVTPESVTRGDAVFHGPGRCARCHGADAKGGTRGSDLTGGHWLHIHGAYDEIVGVVTNGVPDPKDHPRPMPPKGGARLTPEQIRDVAAYVWSLSHRDAR